MSQITRCPNCRTAFKVSETQLAAHGGKVRCGKCSFVFNALACLETPSEADPAPPLASEAPPPAATAMDTQPTAQAAAAPGDKTEPSVADMVQAARKARLAARAVAAQNAAEAAGEAAEPPKQPQPTPAPQSTPQPRLQPDPRDQEALRAALKESPLTLNSVYRPIHTAEDEALFAPPAPPSRWRWLWPLLLVLLLLTALGQAAVHYRLQLATDFPWLRQPLERACAQLGCEMPLPRNAELLRSDYSELTYIPGHSNLVQLAASVRNLAPYAQALPMLELTLTDDEERVVAKKRFTPAQYLSADQKQRSALGPNDELRAFLRLDVGTLSSTGYSLYWFYP
ncbi:DUF3426 domain-containing protein [Chitiniphilus purpureus]|uniref:DUF3426 domain-containing protein n=1 Tax=Chitiniphilus purpureus TaxID=2981137 RepID=A0ABY6DRW7_9NEIS|nr:DUF3426 domain-containing protein [Chitiniphilus sp. CD1]UXY16772.1 DUF3426 domain-containing protein [Chitiniphilus sp. CD1]